jgi:hypothetical protein
VKTDDLSPEHLTWLVKSRAANQQSALRLFDLFERYPKRISGRDFSKTAQILVAVCFSLWRAAFLADKTGKRHAVVEHAKTFLGKMIIDNAITYPQDRNAREWTFNYYTDNAKGGLLTLAKRWNSVGAVLAAKRKVPKGSTTSQRRWNRYHDAFENAVECLTAELEE